MKLKETRRRSDIPQMGSCETADPTRTRIRFLESSCPCAGASCASWRCWLLSSPASRDVCCSSSSSEVPDGGEIRSCRRWGSGDVCRTILALPDVTMTAFLVFDGLLAVVHRGSDVASVDVGARSKFVGRARCIRQWTLALLSAPIPPTHARSSGSDRVLRPPSTKPG